LQLGNQSQSLPAKQNSICEKQLSAGEKKLTRYSSLRLRKICLFAGSHKKLAQTFMLPREH
jgi:hypothetical protein